MKRGGMKKACGIGNVRQEGGEKLEKERWRKVTVGIGQRKKGKKSETEY